MPPKNSPAVDPDVELLARIGSGVPAAVREMVSRKLPRLLSLATRMLGDHVEARDVAQETFVQIWKHARRWQAGRARFDTWVHRVALNLCNDRLRRRKDAVPFDDALETIDPTPVQDAQLDQTSRSERINAALAALPTRQREALILQYYQDCSNVEAAGLMGITVDALESLLSRARRNLRSHLANEREDLFI
jgi:RNA polymerase sigma factor (sigma-70 family)